MGGGGGGGNNDANGDEIKNYKRGTGSGGGVGWRYKRGGGGGHIFTPTVFLFSGTGRGI